MVWGRVPTELAYCRRVAKLPDRSVAPRSHRGLGQDSPRVRACSLAKLYSSLQHEVPTLIQGGRSLGRRRLSRRRCGTRRRGSGISSTMNRSRGTSVGRARCSGSLAATSTSDAALRFASSSARLHPGRTIRPDSQECPGEGMLSAQHVRARHQPGIGEKSPARKTLSCRIEPGFAHRPPQDRFD